LEEEEDGEIVGFYRRENVFAMSRVPRRLCEPDLVLQHSTFSLDVVIVCIVRSQFSPSLQVEVTVRLKWLKEGLREGRTGEGRQIVAEAEATVDTGDKIQA
jgi:hypothetical protein